MENLLNAVSGGLAGMAVDSVLFPLDTIKTRLQARKNAGQATASLPKSSPRPFYRGLLSAMLGSFPAAATFWTVYEAGKRELIPAVTANGKRPELDWIAHSASAALADIAVTAVRNPFEVVKQQMQLGLHKTTREAFRTILRTDGVMRGLYAGWGSTVLREVPFDAIEFTLYEGLKKQWAKLKTAPGEELAPLVLWENALLGSIAGGFAAGVTTPLDVVKTRLMTQTKTAEKERYTGWRDAFSRILKEEGWAALFSGIRPRVAWISVGGAIFIGSYEEAKRQLGGTAAFAKSKE